MGDYYRVFKGDTMSLDYGLCIFLTRPISELKKEYSSMMFDPIPERNQYLIILNPEPLM